MIKRSSLAAALALLNPSFLLGVDGVPPVTPHGLRFHGGEQPTSIYSYVLGVERVSRQVALWAEAIREGNKSAEEFSETATKARFLYFSMLREEKAFQEEGKSLLKFWPAEVQRLWATIEKPKLGEVQMAGAVEGSNLVPDWIMNSPIAFFEEKLRARTMARREAVPREWRFEKAPASAPEE